MNVTIIGWYGTETQGDIAILDGIMATLSALDSHINVNLGSLYKFYTERTLLLNFEIFKINSPNIDINVFDLKNNKERYTNIKDTDLLLIGGGPLNNIREILLLKKCFDIAKKRRIPSMIYGCGIDILTDPVCIDALKSICSDSKLILVRNKKTKDKIINLFDDFYDKIFVIPDPAILSVNNFVLQKRKTILKRNCISINLRRYTIEELISPIYYTDDDFLNFINNLAEQYENVELIPMHTFFIGYDDRYYLSKLKSRSCYENIHVIHKPQNLYELYDSFQTSLGCIGMRYHSVVMQTILNGNNIIFDYTNEVNGKIAGFLEDNDLIQCYENRICHLQNNTIMNLNIIANQLKTIASPKIISDSKESIINFLGEIL